MNKNWVLKSPGNEEAITSLASELGIERSLAQLLAQRNINTFQEARDYFRPDLANLHDPFLMKDMDVAIVRIQEAIQAGEKVMIYGDYDVDGTTAVALVYSYFKDYFKEIDYYIPDRYEEGYGISFKGIDYVSAHGFSLVIALDCGIKAVDKIDYATKKGVEFIICDHHNPGDEIPRAVAVLDPKQKGCPYPYKELSGCGVGLKLVQAYGKKTGQDANKIYDYLDLVVVSIAGRHIFGTPDSRRVGTM
jgi:single-stranded-DNA-specific exonuclease